MAKAQATMEQTQTERQIAPIRAQAEGMKAQASMADAHASMVVAAEKTRQANIQAAMPPKQPA